MTRAPDPRLTWRSRHDERSRGYGVRDLLADEMPPLPHKRLWSPGRVVLDQGREGACTGFAVCHDLAASPHRVRGAGEPLARKLYRRAQQIDEWPGEAYEGSSVLAAVKAAGERGFIDSYRWAFNIEDLQDAVLGLGPAVIGIPWHSSMYRPRPSGLLDLNGDVVGGHAILVLGYHPSMRIRGEGWWSRHDVFVLLNSWGPSYGKKGRAYIRSYDLARLLAENGEACIPLARNTEGSLA